MQLAGFYAVYGMHVKKRRSFKYPKTCLQPVFLSRNQPARLFVSKGIVLRLRIDREKCVSSGNCVVAAPTVFLLDAEQKARLVDPESVDDDTLYLAAEMCPTEAIVLEDENGEQLYP